MANNIVQMKDGNGNKEYPVTSTEAIGLPGSKENLTKILTAREAQAETAESVSAQALLEQAVDIEGLKQVVNSLLNGSLQLHRLATNKIFISGVPYLVKGTDVPSFAPDFIGQEFIDIAHKIAYKAVGDNSVEDWKPVNIA